MEALGEIGIWLKAHSGGVEFVAYDANRGVVSVRLLGACEGCPLADLTLKNGIESFLMDKIPEIKSVIAVQ